MLPPNLAPTPAEPELGYRRPVRQGQVRHAGAVLTAALHSPVVHRLVDGWLCVLRFVAPTGRRLTNRAVAYAQLAYTARFPGATPDDADVFVVVTLRPNSTGGVPEPDSDSQ